MVPPLPTIAPPLALKIPATEVLIVDHTSIDPPLPVCVAEASTKAPCATLTTLALTWLCAVFFAVLPIKI